MQIKEHDGSILILKKFTVTLSMRMKVSEPGWSKIVKDNLELCFIEGAKVFVGSFSKDYRVEPIYVTYVDYGSSNEEVLVGVRLKQMPPIPETARLIKDAKNIDILVSSGGPVKNNWDYYNKAFLAALVEVNAKASLSPSSEEKQRTASWNEEKARREKEGKNKRYKRGKLKMRPKIDLSYSEKDATVASIVAVSENPPSFRILNKPCKEYSTL